MISPLSIFSIESLPGDVMLLLASILVFFAIMSTKLGARFGVPSLLLFLILGMVAGADILGFKFENYHLAESIGHFAMTIILFTGGLSTSFEEVKPIWRQGLILSTLGVFITTILTGLFIYFVTGLWFGLLAMPVMVCILLAAVMASTDSASVFSILRGKGMNLRHNLSPLLELESGSNDPMAYILTIISVGFLQNMSQFGANPWGEAGRAVLTLVLQFVVGIAVGLAVGYAAVWIIKTIKLPNPVLYSIMLLSFAFLANGLADLCMGNGLIALYLAAIIIGNKAPSVLKREVLKFFDGMTWLMQLLMFLMLGLLARPSQMHSIALPAILIALFMIFVARPASVFACLMPFRKLPAKAKLFTSWVGLKGAGPILFALYPVVAGVEGADDIFNIVFFIALMSLLIQGMTLTPLARKLDLCFEDDPKVESFGLELPEEMGMLSNHTVSEDDLVAGGTLRDMHLPHGIRVIMVKRDERFLVPHGSMPLHAGDTLILMLGESDD